MSKRKPAPKPTGGDQKPSEHNPTLNGTDVSSQVIVEWNQGAVESVPLNPRSTVRDEGKYTVETTTGNTDFRFKGNPEVKIHQPIAPVKARPAVWAHEGADPKAVQDAESIVKLMTQTLRLGVDVTNLQATLDGVAYSVKPDGAALLAAMVAADGDWVNGGEVTNSKNPSRVKDALPEPLRELIETRSGGGYRIPRNKLYD